MATPGSTGAGAATLSTASRNGGILVALRPANSPVSIGTATSTTSGTTLATTTTSAVAVNQAVIVAVAMDPTNVTVTVSDTGGNTYNLDEDITNGTLTRGVRTLVFSARVTTALASGATITVTFSSAVVGKASSAYSVGGLAVVSMRDKAAGAGSSGSSTAASSGATATTLQANELVFGAIGVEETTTTATTLTASGSGFTALTGAGTASTTGVRTLPEYEIVSATGAYTASGTLSQARSNATAVVTYKVLGTASKLVMDTEPSSSVTAGGTFSTQPAVYVEDANGNMVVTDSSTVTATVGTGTGPLTGTTTAIASSGVATFSGLAAPTTAQTGLKLTFTDGSLTSVADTTSITVNPGAMSQLVMSPATIVSATAGTSVSGSFISITAEDANGNVCSSGPNAFTGTVTFGGTAGATGTSAVFTAGVLNTFPTLTPTVAGSGKTITATSGAIVGTTTITTVNPGAASKLMITSVNGGANPTAGTAFSVVVQSQDANGNAANAVANTGVSLSLNTGTGTLGGTLTGTITAGTSSVTISGVTYTKAESGVILTAARTNGDSLTAGNSSAFTVNSGAVSQLVMNPTTIASATAGTSVSGSFTSIMAEDANGNVCSSGPNVFTGTVTFGGTAGATGTSAAFIAGVLSTFPTLTPTVAGSGKTITATSGSVVGTTTITTVNPGAIASYTVSATAATRGTAFSVTVTAKDANNNTVTTDSSTLVTMSASPANVQFSGNPMTLSSGTFTISALDNYFETVTITATDGNSKTGNASVTINPLTGDYRSQAGTTWATASTWQTNNGSTWVTASAAPSSVTTNLISVTNTTVTVGTSVTASNLYVMIGGTVSISSGITLTVNNGLASGAIGGGGILAESGTGNLLGVNGTITNSGGTVIRGGTLSVTNVNASGIRQLGTGGITFTNSGTLLNSGSGAQTLTNSITLTNGGGVITMSGPTMTLTGTISGGGGLTSSGSDLILAVASGNNAVGPITVNSGRLFVFNTNSIVGASITTASGATVDFSTGGNTTPTNVMTFASGSCLANRAGTLTVSMTKVTFPSSGTMIFNQDDQVTTGIAINGNYPTLTNNLTIQVGGINSTTGTVTNNGVISGSFGLTKTSTGTLVLNSANTYSGGTTVSTGSLTANVNNSLNGGTLSVASGATVTLTSGTTDTVAALYLAALPRFRALGGGPPLPVQATRMALISAQPQLVF